VLPASAVPTVVPRQIVGPIAGASGQGNVSKPAVVWNTTAAAVPGTSPTIVTVQVWLPVTTPAALPETPEAASGLIALVQVWPTAAQGRAWPTGMGVTREPGGGWLLMPGVAVGFRSVRICCWSACSCCDSRFSSAWSAVRPFSARAACC
jgi:hypothetical protein